MKGDGTFEGQDVKCEGGRHGFAVSGGHGVVAAGSGAARAHWRSVGCAAWHPERRSGHDPGCVFCDLAVMLADGGRCNSDLAALAGQASLFGEIVSVSTARRVLLSVGEAELAAIRAARARARARAWMAGAAPDQVILDFDATPVDSHSEKERAAGHYTSPDHTPSQRRPI